MTETPEPAEENVVKPSRHDRLRPVELLVFAAILAVFAGAIVGFTTRQWMTAVIVLVIAFIVVTLVLALLGLGSKPSAQDLEARKDLQRPEDDRTWH